MRLIFWMTHFSHKTFKGLPNKWSNYSCTWSYQTHPSKCSWMQLSNLKTSLTGLSSGCTTNRSTIVLMASQKRVYHVSWWCPRLLDKVLYIRVSSQLLSCWLSKTALKRLKSTSDLSKSHCLRKLRLKGQAACSQQKRNHRHLLRINYLRNRCWLSRLGLRWRLNRPKKL